MKNEKGSGELGILIALAAGVAAIAWRAGLVLGLSVAVSGCFYREGAKLEGSPAGLRAMFDGMNGMITNGKASADKDTAHWQHRKLEDKELTIRNKDGRTMWQKIGAMMGKESEVK